MDLNATSRVYHALLLLNVRFVLARSDVILSRMGFYDKLESNDIKYDKLKVFERVNSEREFFFIFIFFLLPVLSRVL